MMKSRISRFPQCCWAFLLASFLLTPAAAVDESSVLVLFNQNDPDSVAIKDYYLQIYPQVRAFGLSLNGLGEQIPGQTYLDEIRTPLLQELASQPWGEDIDTFVTTKGLPLRIDVGANPVVNWRRFSSLESELSRINDIDSIQLMGDQDIGPSLIGIPGVISANPYYQGLEFDFLGMPKPYPTPKGFDRSDPNNEGIRLAARLDGFTTQDVFDMIDRAQNASLNLSQYHVVVDDDPSVQATLEDAMERLVQDVLPGHGQTFDYDNTTTPITASTGPVIGYVGHGTHAGMTSSQPGSLQDSGYINTDLDFDLADGAVFHSYESFNSFTFNPNSNAPQTSQALIAQWLGSGGTAALGTVQEPGASKWTVTNEDVFFDMLLNGFTFVESAWAATRQLSFVNTVVGDPLMTLQASLPGDANLDGRVEFNDFYTLQGNWQQEGTLSDGDFNGDGTIDDADFTILSDNWLSSIVGPMSLSEVEIGTAPIQDPYTGFPMLSAWLVNSANLNQDLNIDSGDLSVIENSYGQDAVGDIDGDGQTTGLDILLWQQQQFTYDVPADFDFDAHVTSSDGAIWQNSYNKNLGGDSNGDGHTDGLDFLAWQVGFEVEPGTTSSSLTSTPEPSGMALALLGVLGVAVRRGRKTRFPATTRPSVG